MMASKEDFEKQMRHYCSPCATLFNCPVGTLQFKTCTHKSTKFRGGRDKQPEYKDLIWNGTEFTLRTSTENPTPAPKVNENE